MNFTMNKYLVEFVFLRYLQRMKHREMKLTHQECLLVRMLASNYTLKRLKKPTML